MLIKLVQQSNANSFFQCDFTFICSIDCELNIWAITVIADFKLQKLIIHDCYFLDKFSKYMFTDPIPVLILASRRQMIPLDHKRLANH